MDGVVEVGSVVKVDGSVEVYGVFEIDGVVKLGKVVVLGTHILNSEQFPVDSTGKTSESFIGWKVDGLLNQSEQFKLYAGGSISPLLTSPKLE